MDRLKRSIKRKLSALICTRCGLAGHSDRDQRCPQWSAKELEVYPPLSVQCYAELTSILSGYRDQVSLTDDDIQWRERICRMLENAIKPLYPNAQLVLFGSSANGFGTIHSDLDISMKLRGIIGHKKQASVVRSLVKQLRRQSSRDKWYREDVKCIPWAKVPIVKMMLSRKWNGLECDISVGNYIALHNTEMLSTYARIDERVQILGVALKQFAKSNGVCDASSGSLSSYAYIILLLHYLQQVTPPVIPVLQQVGTSGSTIVDGCNCWFYRFDNMRQLLSVWPHVRRNQSSVGELWVCFFKYYTEEFDWKRSVISVRRLQPLSKLEKNWTNKNVCIEDPFNLSRNLAGHLSDAMWSYIQEVLANGRNRFCDPVFYRTPITCERLFDDCTGTADIPVKPFKRVVLHNPSRSGDLPTTSGKRRHPASNPQDNKIIYIDDDDDDDDGDREEFVSKKQRMISYGGSKSGETQRHVHYSPSPSKRSVSSNPVPINVMSFKSTATPIPEYHDMFPQQQQTPRAHTKPASDHYTPLCASQPLASSSVTRWQQTDPQMLYDRLTSPSPAYTDVSRAPRVVDLHSPATARYDCSSITSDQQAPWLDRTPAHRNHVIPERRRSDHYSSLDTYPTSTAPTYQHTSSHVSDSQAVKCCRGASGSSKNWWTSPEGSLTTGHSSNMSDLFPLLYANSVLSSYSSHHDNRHGDYYYGNNPRRRN